MWLMTLAERNITEHSVLVCRATLAIAEAVNVEDLLQCAANAVYKLTHAEFGAAGLVTEGEVSPPYFAKGPENDVDTEISDFAQKQIMAAFQRRQSLSVNEIDLPALEPSNQHIANWLTVPLVRQQRVVGALCAFNKQGQADFTQQDRELLGMIAAHTAVSMHKTQLLESRKSHSEQLDERNRQLNAFSIATNNIAGELALDKVLQQIVDSARVLIRAEYAALGVPDIDGVLETFIYSGMSLDKIRQMPHFPKGLGLLGAIVRERRSIRIPHIGSDPRSVGFPENHPPMTSFLGVPIVAGGHTLGNLYLTNKIGADEFSTDDQKLAELLATHAAVAIQNARLYEQVGRLVVVEERTRIGRDLHDGIIQSIYAVGLTLESVRLILTEHEREDVDPLLEVAIDGLNDTIRDIRNFILDLRPHRFQGNLRSGLARLLREFQANTMVAVTFDADEDELADLRTPLARAVFFTTQEALANVARHARAKEVHITLRRTKNQVLLRVQDDGRGFDTRMKSASVGHGLSNMRARAEELRGGFQLESTPGKGTAVSLALPLDAAQD